MSMTRLETFCNLGYRRDPFTGGALFETGDMARVRRILTMAVESRAMVSIVGERGIGKSRAVETALEKIGVRRISVERAQKERVTIADVQKAMLIDLKESPKRDGELMGRQLRRVVGEASAKNGAKPMVVVIEEAQRLHGNTLRSLKTLREIEWLGERELFGVILVAQSDPMNRAGVAEVRLRTDLIRMQGLSPDEASAYLRATIGRHFDDAALEAVGVLPQAANYLELQELAVALLNHSLADGRGLVCKADVAAVAGSHTAEPLPKTRPTQGAKPEPVSGATALRSVLSRRNEGGEQVPGTGNQDNGRFAC